MHTLKVFYRPDGYPDWVLWREFSQVLDMIGKPSQLDIAGIPSGKAGFAVRVSLGKPQDACDLTTRRRLRRGYQFQVKFTGTGHVTIDRFRLHAQRLIERSTAKC
jgi:hypothetical protein